MTGGGGESANRSGGAHLCCLYPAVVILLEFMVENGDADTRGNARAYLKCIADIDFIIPLFVVSKIFAITKPYSEALQDKKCGELVIRPSIKCLVDIYLDLIQCYDNIENIGTYLTELKYDKTKLDKLQNDLEQFSRDTDVELKISRTSKHKTIELYLKHIYETFIQTTLDHLSYRFSEHQKNSSENHELNSGLCGRSNS
ncbi:unnamed protein product [Didymodactylos carnosus]|uniref:Uncharacterized protein n=1 Tax=Didymodactylos carnosus TaxID=1234261 RepID=A0A815UA20_9BILA|nr:unnamed protein product [Didymodactylos carnosus]CAF4374941.1 unnamed protein product [Didymodactylos carnosus]